MAIRFYKMFDMMNRRGMKKTDLREILSPKTVAKLSKGDYVSGEVIDKLCEFFQCQPGDIMEYTDIMISDENRMFEVTPRLNEGTGKTDIESARPYEEG